MVETSDDQVGSRKYKSHFLCMLPISKTNTWMKGNLEIMKIKGTLRNIRKTISTIPSNWPFWWVGSEPAKYHKQLLYSHYLTYITLNKYEDFKHHWFRSKFQPLNRSPYGSTDHGPHGSLPHIMQLQILWKNWRNRQTTILDMMGKVSLSIQNSAKFDHTTSTPGDKKKHISIIGSW